MKSNTIKLVLLACVALGLGYLLLKEPPAPKIVTRYDALPIPVDKLPAATSNTHPNVDAPPEVVATASSTTTTPTQPESNSSATPPTKIESIADKIGLKDLKVQYLDPNTPCPVKRLSCFAEPGGMIIDASCPTYKPVWAYVSLDKGQSWDQVGCFATELDATRAIEKAKQSGAAKVAATPIVVGKIKAAEKTSSAYTSAITSPTVNNITTNNAIAERNLQEKSSETTSNARPVATAPESSHTVVAPTNETEKTVTLEPTPSKNDKVDKAKTEDLTVTFRTAFGLVSVEKRTYPDIETKQKAVKMWDNGQRLLEPDGSINDKYMVKPSDSKIIPGVQ